MLLKEEMQKVNRRNASYMYMEYLRVICAFMVIMIHVSGANWFKIEIGSANWIIHTFYNLFGRFSVCVFCMISGALLLRPDKTICIHDIFHKNIKRILICFVTWIILYDVFYTVMYKGGFTYFIQNLFKMPRHLWYLLMLIGLYLAIPVLKPITKDKALTRYLITLLVVFGTIFGMFKGINGFFKPLLSENTLFNLWDMLLTDLGEMNISFVPGYLGCFLLGHYIHEYGLGKWHSTFITAAIPALLLSALLTILASQVSGKYVYTFMMETNPLIILASAGIMAFFRGRQRPMLKDRSETFTEKAAVLLGSLSMGIYLIHLAVLESLAHYLNITVASFNPLFSIPLLSLLVFIVSALLAAVLKKIPLLRSTVI